VRKPLAGSVVVLLLVVAAPAAFLFVPSPMQKWAVERLASAALGRQVTSGGPFRLRAWPPLAITAPTSGSRTRTGAPHPSWPL
jgi:uncharacterized protein involved in outer membrane biogenesis